MEESGGTSAAGRGLVTVSVLVLIGLVGLLAFLAGRDDPGDAVRRSDERFPATSTTGPPTTVASSSTVTSTTAAPTSTTVGGSTTTTVPTTPIGDVVPNVAAFAELLATPVEAQPQIDQLLVAGRHDVAVTGPVLSLCATVSLQAPLTAGGRWERDGREISTSAPIGRAPPGFGECLSDGGEALPDGSYQFIATDVEGNESAAGGLVVGAQRIEQRFTNNGSEPLCAVRIAPSDASYFEVYVYDGAPIAPGSLVTLPVAEVDQDVEAVACGSGEIVAGFDFEPQAGEVQALVP